MQNNVKDIIDLFVNLMHDDNEMVVSLNLSQLDFISLS